MSERQHVSCPGIVGRKFGDLIQQRRQPVNGGLDLVATACPDISSKVIRAIVELDDRPCWRQLAGRNAPDALVDMSKLHRDVEVVQHESSFHWEHALEAEKRSSSVGH
jgi:hypothetical protein